MVYASDFDLGAFGFDCRVEDTLKPDAHEDTATKLNLVSDSSCELVSDQAYLTLYDLFIWNPL